MGYGEGERGEAELSVGCQVITASVQIFNSSVQHFLLIHTSWLFLNNSGESRKLGAIQPS